MTDKLPAILVLHAAEMAEVLSSEAERWPAESSYQKLFNESCNTIRAMLKASGYGPGAGDRWEPEHSQRWCVLPVAYVKELREGVDTLAAGLKISRHQKRDVDALVDAAMDQPNPSSALRDALTRLSDLSGRKR